MGLAGKSSTENIDGCQIVAATVAHVGESRHIGPVFREHPSGERVDFNLPRNVEPGAGESKIEPSDTGEQ